MNNQWARWTLLLLVGSGCVSTRVATQWKDENASGPPPKKLLVAVDVPTKSVRYLLEDKIADELTSRGFHAVPVTQTNLAKATPSKQSLEDAAKNSGFDGVLVSKYVNTVHSYAYGGGWYGGGWYGAPYSYAYPMDYDVQQHAIVETNLYDTQNEGALRWTATSSTVESAAGGSASSTSDLAHFAKVIATQLQKDFKG
jgi:hypothetical protein